MPLNPMWMKENLFDCANTDVPINTWSIIEKVAM